jgi:hypothetical protein
MIRDRIPNYWYQRTRYRVRYLLWRECVAGRTRTRVYHHPVRRSPYRPQPCRLTSPGCGVPPRRRPPAARALRLVAGFVDVNQNECKPRKVA